MAVDSFMVELGTPVPPFTLTDVRTGETFDSATVDGPLLVMFICNHCPYVKHVQSGLVALGRDYAETPLTIVAVSSNDAESYPDDAPDRLATVADELGYDFPVLYDESQSVARAFKAACTPDFFVYDSDGMLFYRGQMDDSRPRNGLPVTGDDLRAALDAASAGADAPADQVPSVGCGIKWKPGNEPQ